MTTTPIDTSRRLEKIIADYGDLLGSDVNVLRHDCGIATAAEIESNLQRLQDEGRHLQIGFIGRVKAGKSSLLNALFFDGQTILPKAATPMTAALTSLSYGERPAINLEFFTQDEQATFKRYYEEHEQAIAEKLRAIQTRLSALPTSTADRRPDDRQPGLASTQSQTGRADPPDKPAAQASGHSGTQGRNQDGGPRTSSATPPSESLLKQARLEAEKEDPLRHAGWQQWFELRGFDARPESDRIECASVEELQERLSDYVGVHGRFMPLTKCLHLVLPDEKLRDLRVVDTPGFNDPIVSREARTQAMLKECDAVFIVSPAGQFLNQQDEALLDRLTTREGVRAIYVVASQFDTQLFGHERERCGGRLPEVVDMQRAALARHADQVMSQWSRTHPTLTGWGDGRQELRISSAAAQALLWSRQEEAGEWLQKRLNDRYPDYLTTAADRARWLGALSGIESLEKDIQAVREKRQSIFDARVGDYLVGQRNASRKLLEQLQRRAVDRKETFERADLGNLDHQIRDLEAISKKAIGNANAAFRDAMERIRLDTIKVLRDLVRRKYEDTDADAERAQGSYTETREREKEGMLSWLARKTRLGGYESYTATVRTINATQVRGAVKDFRDFLQHELIEEIDRRNLGWRNEVVKELLAQLRETIGDSKIDADAVRSSSRAVLLTIADLPSPQLPELPDALSPTGKLESWRADEFEAACEQFLETLRDAGLAFVDSKIAPRLKQIQGERVGDLMFEDRRKELDLARDQLQNKRLTAARFERLLTELSLVVT